MLCERNIKRIFAFLKNENQTIWVRNASHTGKETSYVNQYIKLIEHEGKNHIFYEYLGTYTNLNWVKMNINLALERIILGKKHLRYVPEWLSECYIMDDQVNRLVSSKLFRIKEQVKRIMN